jgi:plasmid stabilization system protein ParE
VKLDFNLVARRDLREALAYIAADNPRTAERQEQLVRTAAFRLTDFPDLGRPLDRRRRLLQVRGTRFRLVYIATRDAIVILRVWHGARQWPPASS